MDLLVATTNPKKRAELEALLEGLPVRVRSLEECPGAPEVVEDAPTLEGNAAKKATETALACGRYSVADDSGLFVDALGGAPGVHSRRWVGPNPTREKWCRRLLEEMEGVPEGQRGAHFRCCIAMADPEGRVVLTAEGRCGGRITQQMRGQGGFGYDPVFYYEPAGKTFAQMEPEQKNRVSHRGRALAAFRDRLRQFLPGRAD